MPKTQRERQSLKDAAADTLYQSTFLPIFQDAETRIKKAIARAFLLALPKRPLLQRIEWIIAWADSKVPKDLKDREAYIQGLRRSAERWVRKGYDEPMEGFAAAVGALSTIRADRIPRLAARGVSKAKESPRALAGLSKAEGGKIVRYEWAEAKGAEMIKDYPKELKKALERLAEEPSVSSEPGKRPITLWQRAELDVRHERQMDMIEKQRESGVDLVWISTHPDCSKRCAKWQGKLFSLTEHTDPLLGGFKVRKHGKRWVYSLTDIMAQTDKYGYHNNIISGFNCRHRTIPYTPGTLPPKEYGAEEIKREREIETKIRQMEREIRILKTKAELYNELDPKAAEGMRRLAESAVKAYEKYCREHGYAAREYRIDIRLSGGKYAEKR